MTVGSLLNGPSFPPKTIACLGYSVTHPLLLLSSSISFFILQSTLETRLRRGVVMLYHLHGPVFFLTVESFLSCWSNY
jgi:hypothetical protein